MTDQIPEPGEVAVRLEDHRLLTGDGCFVDDTPDDGHLHAAFVRSPVAHAEIVALDLQAARSCRGVVGIHVAQDLISDGLRPLPCPAVLEGQPPLVVPPRHALALERVRYVGEAVAMVIAERPEQAREAADLVQITYNELPAVTDPREALAPHAPAIWEQCPGNQAFAFRKGDPDAVAAAFDNATHRVELDLENNRVAAAPIETRAGIASYDPRTERFTLLCNGQGLHSIRAQLARDVFGLPLERFHLYAPDVGGGFGLKNFLYPEWVALPWASRHHRRTIRWVEDRSEQFLAAAHGRGMWAHAELALDADGNFLALRADVVANMGAYLSGGGPNVSTKACPTAMGGVYAIPDIYMEVRGAYTTTMCLDAYRGAGKPEANYLIERLIDTAARRCGFDPIELRLRNGFSHYPHQTAFGLHIDSGQVQQNIERVKALIDLEGLPARRQVSQQQGFLRGLGVACFLETSRGAPQEGVAVRFPARGIVEIAVGTESNGQGHETAFSQIAAARLGVPVSALRYIQADTDKTQTGFGHGGARSMHMGGRALVEAIDAVLEKAHTAASRLLQSPPEAVTFHNGQFIVDGTDQVLTLLDVAGALMPLEDETSPEPAAPRFAAPSPPAPSTAPHELDTFALVEDAPFTFPNGAHAAEVTVDQETGEVRLHSYAMADDYGNLINPMLTEGQLHGGVAQGIGQALGEGVVYDPESGQLLSGSFMDYFLPRANSLPNFEVCMNGTATAANPLGVKGSGQAGAIAAPQTIVNAVLNALSPLGVDHLDMPLTAESVWRAMTAAKN